MRFLQFLSLVLFCACPAAAMNAGHGNAVRLSFGRVMPDDPIEQVIEFANPTNEVLEIESIQLSPPLLAKDYSPIVLPGMKGAFTLVLGTERSPGPFKGSVQVNFKEFKHPPLIFEIEGYVIPPIEFVPGPAFFVATHSGKLKTASIEVINHRDEPLFLKSAQSHNDRYTTSLETIEEGQHYRLSLTLDGAKEPGDQTDEIILRADPPLDEPLKVQANTRIRARVYHFPDSVDMGSLPLKVAKDGEMVQKLSQILMVYRPGTDDFKVDASTDLDYIGLVGERGPDGDRYQMTLTLIPEKVKPGKIEGTVTIKTNDEEFPVLGVRVTGYILD